MIKEIKKERIGLIGSILLGITLGFALAVIQSKLNLVIALIWLLIFLIGFGLLIWREVTNDCKRKT